MHVHGLWLPLYHRALAVSRRIKKPYLLSVHGMLERGALGFSRWKKRMALFLYQKKDLQLAPVLHATTRSELQTVRAFGLRQPVVTLPIGVRFSSAEQKPLRNGIVRHALFLGRIHPVKGVLPLVDAWAAVRPKGWQLDLAGPDEAGHLEVVRRRLCELNLEQEVVYHGPAFGEAKEKLLAKASLMVVPSLSENFGVVVAEGLAHRLPVITTEGTPWAVLAREGCGWCVPLGCESLAGALRDALALSPEKLEEMGTRGKVLAEREFSWPRIAEQMNHVYAWLKGQGARPACVGLD
jgi:glycosyltransferase involved in cell wall biosynthesis